MHTLVLLRPVLFLCGTLSLTMSLFMLLPAYVALLLDPQDAQAFLVGSAVALLTGMVLTWRHRDPDLAMGTHQVYLLAALGWLLVAAEGAVPLLLGLAHLSPTDAVFESVSGITTTGSTVFTELAQLGPAMLLWRSMLQWVGGFGVIGLGISILPYLRIGGMRLFRTEHSDWTDKSLPRLRQLASSLLGAYVTITLACALAYWLSGLTAFEAINYAMTTVSTGGFGTDDRSMAQFGTASLWVGIVFMIAGALPFLLWLDFLARPGLRAFRDEQVRGFLWLLAILSLVLAIELIATERYAPLDALTHAAFNLVSVVTTTGYVSSDYAQWGQFSLAMFCFVMLIGGCSGSTSGGMKIFRFQLAYLLLRSQLRHLLHPHGVFSAHFNRRTVDDDIIVSAVAFSFLFLVSLAVTTVLLAMTGLDFVTSFSGAATALANVGPGLGDSIGPVGNFAGLPDSAKWILSFAMLLGRLELLSVLVILSPIFWRG